MAARDKTLLASLGFADKDKKNPLHDRACQYMADPVTASTLGNQVVLAGYRDWLQRKGSHGIYQVESVARISHQASEQEVVLSKGASQYKTTVGFLDVVLHFSVCFIRKTTQYDKNPDSSTQEHWESATAVCEVKAGETPIGDIVRQVKLYQEFYKEPHHGVMHVLDVTRRLFWIVATVYPMAPIDVQTLWQAGIPHIQLGDKFRKWLSETNATKPGDPGTIQSLEL